MKKTVLYSAIGVVLMLGLVLAMVMPVMAQEHEGFKHTEWADTSGHPEDVYLVGQTVYYSIGINNTGNESLEIETLWDTIPVQYLTWDPIPGVTRTYWWNDTAKQWVNEDPNSSFTIPGAQSWNVTFNYTIREQDVSWHPAAGYNAMINRFSANGTAGESVRVTKTVQVIQPEMELDKAVAPSVAVPGQNVTYNFTITNTGDWPLDNITLVDNELGNLTGELPANLVLNSTGEAGDSYSFDYDYEIQAGDLPLLINTATVQGTAQGFNATIFADAVVSDSDTARVTSEAPPVGGTAYPVGKLSILAPWIALGAAIVAGAAIFLRRRRVGS